jgi:hypothetical protein
MNIDAQIFFGQENWIVEEAIEKLKSVLKARFPGTYICLCEPLKPGGVWVIYIGSSTKSVAARIEVHNQRLKAHSENFEFYRRISRGYKHHFRILSQFKKGTSSASHDNSSETHSCLRDENKRLFLFIASSVLVQPDWQRLA